MHPYVLLFACVEWNSKKLGKWKSECRMSYSGLNENQFCANAGSSDTYQAVILNVQAAAMQEL